MLIKLKWILYDGVRIAGIGELELMNISSHVYLLNMAIHTTVHIPAHHSYLDIIIIFIVIKNIFKYINNK